MATWTRIILFSLLFLSCKEQTKKDIGEVSPTTEKVAEKKHKVEVNYSPIIIGSFLGDVKRCYYGDNPPSELNLIWKCWLGGGISHMPYNDAGTDMRYGAGWTGQPLMFTENNSVYLIQGSYESQLKKNRR